ncbi:MAG: betaine/proline/choline family ABC transporter ATP-binding protein [Candidatus Nanopelagicales bacterium]|nr:betaine/proline/choline family ABC transporter ATP-binding protein [Candidatus Nanopelagicales bacterium]NKB92078.1 betaine/proline/choline family ABC transporter ATP-binding protein [Candidatus Nanopelagicales bacterium]
MSTQPLIQLEHVTKVYPGVETPAVKDLNLEVNPGEILVLVGPSGCGKSTTLRLINRMIEPSSGRIIYEGEDVTKGDPNELRRRMGYVIQQIGLFPHRTIAENIATVPRLLKWPKDKVNARVDELLEVVSMDPSIYRDRYPSELSGGQAQRVGVARALGADPDVLLMDEPFGAIDPITRDRLQNEFLRLQEELKKTIVFVTHDVDEAVKMGDRIAILRDQSEIAQLDTPEHILTDPADEFVENFLGSGAILKTLTLRRVKDIELSPLVTLKEPFQRDQALAMMNEANTSVAVLLDGNNHPTRWIDERALNRSSGLEKSGRPISVQLQPEDTLQDALSAMLTSAAGMAVVVDARGNYLGGCTVESLAALLIQTGSESSGS